VYGPLSTKSEYQRDEVLRDFGVFILLMKTLFFELSRAVIKSSWCCCMRTVLSVVLQSKFPERTGVKNGHSTLGVSVGEQD